jgi:hypothetical protein
MSQFDIVDFANCLMAGRAMDLGESYPRPRDVVPATRLQPAEPTRAQLAEDEHVAQVRYDLALDETLRGEGPFCTQDGGIGPEFDREQYLTFFARFCALLRRFPPMSDAELGKLARLEFARLADEYANEERERT